VHIEYIIKEWLSVHVATSLSRWDWERMIVSVVVAMHIVLDVYVHGQVCLAVVGIQDSAALRRERLVIAAAILVIGP
tara:strand:- start:267 stop:497 length:231 start_codon:yes stop_codon:yes gene_type:complete